MLEYQARMEVDSVHPVALSVFADFYCYDWPWSIRAVGTCSIPFYLPRLRRGNGGSEWGEKT